jgi:hypothetical protein
MTDAFFAEYDKHHHEMQLLFDDGAYVFSAAEKIGYDAGFAAGHKVGWELGFDAGEGFCRKLIVEHRLLHTEN